MIDKISDIIELMSPVELALFAILGVALIGWWSYKLTSFILWRRVWKPRLDAVRQRWEVAENIPGATDWRELVPNDWRWRPD